MEGCILTIDAIGTQEEIANKIVHDKKSSHGRGEIREYFLTYKAIK